MDKVDRRSELAGLGTLALAVILLLSTVSLTQETNWLGLMGYGIGKAFQYCFGLASYLVIGYVGFWGWRLLVGKRPANPLRETIAFGIALFSICILLTVVADQFAQAGAFFQDWVYSNRVAHVSPLAYLEERYNLGGAPFYLLYADIFHLLLSMIGTTLIFTSVGAYAVLVMCNVQIMSFFKKEPKPKPAPKLVVRTPPPPLPKTPPAPTPIPRPKGNYSIPVDVQLTEGKKINQASLKQDLERQAKTLEETLANFGIEAKVGEINCGPTITSFEVHPAVGVKVQRIKALEKDIALNMQAKSIRIIAPIPGKAAVGIEVPNAQPQPVDFADLLSSYRSQPKKAKIPLLLGKKVNGDPLISDLTLMPHLIIAGATGSGKSVCLNAIIMSLLMNMTPEEVRILMIDPKKVELTGYSELPHMIAPVITEPHEACLALKWLVREMQHRYHRLKEAGERNIESYNKHNPKEKLCYMVGIVDELADLMMVSSSDIETPITRIAQMARAVGIHLILATQRPSREVITGLIKANFPARIAFKVANRINSQIILDDTGAESLLGMGDMLVLGPGSSHLVRAQGVYISDSDINKVVSEITRRSPPNYLMQNFQPQLTDTGEGQDSLYAEALDIVRAAGVASTTFLQRKLKIGYARAASIVDELEENGVIGPQEGAKPRKVLIGK